MNAQRFSVHVDRDDLAEQDLAAALSRRPAPGAASGRPAQDSAVDAGHHGARDEKQAARARSERDHARGGNTGKGRSYAFRRS